MGVYKNSSSSSSGSVTVVTEFRHRISTPTLYSSLRTELPWMYPDRDEVRDSVWWWWRLTVSIPGSCYSFAARKVRGWLEPPARPTARPSLTPQGTRNSIFALTSSQPNTLFSQLAFQWRIIRPATLVSLHSLGHTRRSMCAVGSRPCVLVSCYKSKIE